MLAVAVSARVRARDCMSVMPQAVLCPHINFGSVKLTMAYSASHCIIALRREATAMEGGGHQTPI